MNTSDFFLSFVSTFPTSLSNGVIYVLAFLFFACLLMEPVPLALKSDSDWKNQKLWLSSGFQKVQEQTQMILHGWFLSDIFHPHLICGSYGFYSASLQCPTDFQQFSCRGRDGLWYKAGLTFVFYCFLSEDWLHVPVVKKRGSYFCPL